MIVLGFKDKFKIISKRRKIKLPQVASELGIESSAFRDSINKGTIKESEIKQIGNILGCKTFIRLLEKGFDRRKVIVSNVNCIDIEMCKFSYHDELCMKLTREMFEKIGVINDDDFKKRTELSDLYLKDIIAIGNEIGYDAEIIFRFNDGSEL